MSTAQLVDATSCEKILRYLEKDDRITQIVEVIDKSLPISEVGDLFTEENSVEKVKELFRQKKIITYKDKRFCRTPHKNCVDCLRLEPYYLIKNLYKPYI